MKSSIVILLITLIFSYASAQAQNVVGTWKRTAMMLTEASGKTEDSTPELTKAMPCTTGITYSFLGDASVPPNTPGLTKR
ncbi:hypothetical protein [Spirosoma sp.]|uniref:hypothetical protein n=1 Tax=Spirosoma sp. TaxID=1899569 RepID=UPI003B3B861B